MSKNQLLRRILPLSCMHGHISEVHAHNSRKMFRDLPSKAALSSRDRLLQEPISIEPVKVDHSLRTPAP